MSDKLKPCPFCGSIPFIDEIPQHKHTIAIFMLDCEGECFVECKCSCVISAKNKEEAIKKWNRRTYNHSD